MVKKIFLKINKNTKFKKYFKNFEKLLILFYNKYLISGF